MADIHTHEGWRRDSGDLRSPPCNLEAERGLIGGIFLDNKAYDLVADFLRPDHFADPVNARIYAAAAKIIDAGGLATPITLKNYTDADDLVREAGGVRYLVSLAGGVVTKNSVGDYGRLIHDLWMRRECISIGEQFLDRAFAPDVEESAEELIETTEQRLFDLTAGDRTDSNLVAFDVAADEAIELAEQAYRRDGALAGITTGLRDLDAKLGGLHASDVVILAGRPSMGKTALATTIAYRVAEYFRTTEREDHKGKRVAFFSLEMSKAQLAHRVLAALSYIDSHRIRTGRLSHDEFEKLVRVKTEARETPLDIDDAAAPSIAAIRTRCRRLARNKKGTGVGLVVIDYLQLIDPKAEAGRKNENRVQEVSAITRGLKALAKQLNVPIIALSQLSRAVEARDDKRPQLSDLRESGTIEQDSDVVIFPFREQYYLERTEPQQKPEESDEKFVDRHSKWMERIDKAANICEAIIAKNRHGPISTVRLRFDGPRTWFDDLEEIHSTGGPAGPTPPPHNEPPPAAEVQGAFTL